MSERDHMRKIFGFHPPLRSSAPSQPEPCPHCRGTGTEADYEGLEMKPVATDCSFCYGTGLLNKLND